MNTFDHTYPTPGYKNYLDGKGKYIGHKPCICEECKKRRENENAPDTDGDNRDRKGETTK
jgi:hypothetical protein